MALRSCDTQDKIKVYTTRPDTIFGASFIAIAADHPIALKFSENNKKLEAFIGECRKLGTSEEALEKAEKKGFKLDLSMCHPFVDGSELPVYVANFVLMEYGTGAVFGCPAHDQRDLDFARKYDLDVKAVVIPKGKAANEDKGGVLINSDFLNGMKVKDAIKKILFELESKEIGEKQINYRMRDAVFSRQRYWGEPVPMYFKDGVPYPIAEKDLPIELPEVDKYLPTEDGQPPLGNAKDFNYSPEGDNNSYPKKYSH